MIVWGGALFAVGSLSTGARYNPASNTWTELPTAGAPSARNTHTAVWTGSEMIVWGGSYEAAFETGGRYNPLTNTWTALPIAGAPSARTDHTAVWTESEMIVWGGSVRVERLGGSFIRRFDTGGRYNPWTDTWTALRTTGAPSARTSHTAVWTGSEMIVWGGMGWQRSSQHRRTLQFFDQHLDRFARHRGSFCSLRSHGGVDGLGDADVGGI